MADKKKMTVAEMLAAARKADSKQPDGAAAEEAPAPAAEGAPAETPAAQEPAPVKPAAAKPAAPKDGKKLSVAEMLAAARAEKAGGTKPAAAAPAPKPAAEAPKPAAKPAAAAPKPAAKETAAVKERDTTSILAAARKTAKPGPVSKSDVAVAEKKPAAVKVKPTVPPMPEKPAYARARPATAAAGADRRSFMAATLGVFFGSSLAIGFTSLAITNLLWVLGLARFMFPNVLIEPPTRFRVGAKDDYAPGQVSEKFKAQFGVWIVRYEYEGQPMIFALKTVCTHLGCTPNWLEGEQKFKCPCHGSGFYKDGINFEGPAPRPLERYAISEVAGELLVDKSATFNEETGQWADPASFVPA